MKLPSLQPPAMPFAQLPVKDRLLEVLRWICVLPATFVVDRGVQALVQIAIIHSLFREMSYEGAGRWMRYLLARGLAGVAMVLVGATVAPRFRRTTALVLALGSAAMATLIHWIMNGDYLPAIVEGVAMACGVALVLWLTGGGRRA